MGNPDTVEADTVKEEVTSEEDTKRI